MRQADGSMLRLKAGGSVGLTRSTTNAVPLPSRKEARAVCEIGFDRDGAGRLDSRTGGDLFEIDPEAGVALLIPGLAVMAVIDADDREIGRVQHRDRGERADIHQ